MTEHEAADLEKRLSLLLLQQQLYGHLLLLLHCVELYHDLWRWIKTLLKHLHLQLLSAKARGIVTSDDVT